MVTTVMTFFPCLSLDETERFYTEIVGMKTVFSQGNVKIFGGVGGQFGFVDYGDQRVAAPYLCLSLNCDSDAAVDAEYERVLAAGGQPTAAPAPHPKQPVYSFFLKDPSGYLVEFQKLRGVML